MKPRAFTPGYSRRVDVESHGDSDATAAVALASRGDDEPRRPPARRLRSCARVEYRERRRVAPRQVDGAQRCASAPIELLRQGSARRLSRTSMSQGISASHKLRTVYLAWIARNPSAKVLTAEVKVVKVEVDEA